MDGVGLRRGRRDPDQLLAGDALDCWRVECIEPGRRLRLGAEMRLPGRAWLELEVEPDGDGARVRQTAIFVPVGLSGLAYWYGIYPLHQLVFAGRLRGIAARALAVGEVQLDTLYGPWSNHGVEAGQPQPAPQDPPATPSRRARKKERTRQEIYGAALSLFGERGFDAVSVEQICREADVARATFFLHFPTKSALLFEFSRLLAAELTELLREPRPDAVSELHRMLDLFSERWLERGAVMAAMLREFLRTPESVLALHAEGRELRALVEAIVERGQHRGELRADVDARLAAAIFFSTSLAILSGSVFPEHELTPESVRAQFLTAFFHGLVAPSAPGQTRRRTR